MQQNKDLDRLFQEKFKDFEMQPDPEIWKAIENNLSNKKKRKPIIIWFRIVGSAVAIFLLLLVINDDLFNNKQDDVKENIVLSPVNNDNRNKEKADSNMQFSDKEKTLITENDTKVKTNKTEINSSFIKKRSTIISATNLVISNIQNKINAKKIESVNQIEPILSKIIDKSLIVNVDENVKGKHINNNLKKLKVELNESINESILVDVNQKEKEKNNKIDLEDTLASENKENKYKKFSVGTSYSPIYYTSLSKGSPVSESLFNNKNKNNYSSSYGIKFEYRINKKWSIQSGIHTVDLAYTTKNVNVSVLESTSSINSFSNLESAGGKHIYITPMQNILFSPSTGVLSVSGSLQQNIGYIEIPTELKYNILFKKIDLQLLGGFSTLLLNDNQILLNNEESTFIVGEASNLNKTNFSANVGLDLNYNISKKWFVNLSPSFKYQLKTFSENSGGFKPYLISVNTGLNFKF